MKSQNDLIFTIVAVVIGLGCAAGFFFTKREPIQPAAPTTVPTAKVALPAPEPAMANGLSGGNNAAGGFGGFPGGPGGMGGRPGVGMPGMPGGAPGGMGGPGGGGVKPRIGGMASGS